MKRRPTTSFFRDVLGVHLKDHRQSWGAADTNANKVFLLVWENLYRIENGVKQIQVDWSVRESKSRGYDQRRKHLELIRNGAMGIGIRCNAHDSNEVKKKIKSIDEDTCYLLGDFVEHPEGTYAIVEAVVSLGAILSDKSSHLSTDLDRIFESAPNVTAALAMIEVRLGQGVFRQNVLSLWENCCCVTGSHTLDAVRASHIKPWRMASPVERLDPKNGLPLVATLDALFDRGLISFDDSGDILISEVLPIREREIHGLFGLKINGEVTGETLAYLAFHREEIFLKGVES